MSLYAHRLARVIERRSLEAANPNLPKLDGMTHEQYLAAHGLERGDYIGARRRNRLRALVRDAVAGDYGHMQAPAWGRLLVGWDR